MRLKGNARKLATLLLAAVFLFTGCTSAQIPAVSAVQAESQSEPSTGTESSAPVTAGEPEPLAASVPEPQEEQAPVLLYQGHASLRIETPEGKVIYIDPYAGEGYEIPADLILVTHQHMDHNQIALIENRNPGCVLITQDEALAGGVHQIFELDYVTVEAVEAGYNALHDVRECVGYILSFPNGKSVYITGDTSTTQQIPLLAERGLDYAFYCCDGMYNMDLEEAAACANLVGAKYSIPYHMTIGELFSREIAEQFQAENRLIVEAGEEITLGE